MKEHYLSILDLPVNASVTQVKEALFNRLNDCSASGRTDIAAIDDVNRMYLRIVQCVAADLIQLKEAGGQFDEPETMSGGELLVLLLDASWQLYRAGEYECVIYALADAIQVGNSEPSRLSAEIFSCCALAMAAIGDDAGARMFMRDAIAAASRAQNVEFQD